jgi:hypothetical protein
MPALHRGAIEGFTLGLSQQQDEAREHRGLAIWTIGSGSRPTARAERHPREAAAKTCLRSFPRAVTRHRPPGRSMRNARAVSLWSQHRPTSSSPRCPYDKM